MYAIPIGKIAVPTPGTPVPITAAMVSTAANAAGVPSFSRVHKIELCAVPGNAGVVTIKSLAGVPLKGLPAPASGFVACFCSHDVGDADGLDATRFAVDAATAADGAYATLWVS